MNAALFVTYERTFYFQRTSTSERLLQNTVIEFNDEVRTLRHIKHLESLILKQQDDSTCINVTLINWRRMEGDD